MKKKIDIYKDFKGYNAYPVMEAERIIRGRILKEFSQLINRVGECEQKAKGMRLIKILEHIIVVKSRMNRMKKEIQERDDVFVPVYLKAKIAHVDEQKLKVIDFRLIELIMMIKDILELLTCAESDTHIINKFNQVNEYLREMEDNCHKRALVLKKEIF